MFTKNTTNKGGEGTKNIVWTRIRVYVMLQLDNKTRSTDKKGEDTMRKRNTQVASVTCRMTDLPGLCNYVGLGRNSALQLAKEAGAIRKYGRRTLFDLRLVDLALDDLPEKTGTSAV